MYMCIYKCMLVCGTGLVNAAEVARLVSRSTASQEVRLMVRVRFSPATFS